MSDPNIPELTVQTLHPRPFDASPPEHDLQDVLKWWQALQQGNFAVRENLLARHEALMELGREHGLQQALVLHATPVQDRPKSPLPFGAAPYHPGQFGVAPQGCPLVVYGVTTLQERHGLQNWPVTEHFIAESIPKGGESLGQLDMVGAALQLFKAGEPQAETFLLFHLEGIYRLGFEWGLGEAWELTGHQTFFWSDSTGFHEITLMPESET